jgi:hypothetical protein
LKISQNRMKAVDLWEILSLKILLKRQYINNYMINYLRK